MIFYICRCREKLYPAIIHRFSLQGRTRCNYRCRVWFEEFYNLRKIYQIINMGHSWIRDISFNYEIVLQRVLFMKSLMKRSIGALLVFDVTNRKSYESIVNWYEDIKGFACSKIQIFIVGNKMDLVDLREVSYEEAKVFANQNGFEYYETSAKTAENIDLVFEKISEKILLEIEAKNIDPQDEIFGIKIGTLTTRTQSSIIKSEQKQKLVQKDQKSNCC